LFNLDCKVEVAPKGMFVRKAPVSNNESALNFKLDLLDLDQMRGWNDALEDYINKVKYNFD